jgi:hypothetical protein
MALAVSLPVIRKNHVATAVWPCEPRDDFNAAYCPEGLGSGAVVPILKSDGRLYEYACHEGNYALPNILRGARAQEKVTAQGAKTGSEKQR